MANNVQLSTVPIWNNPSMSATMAPESSSTPGKSTDRERTSLPRGASCQYIATSTVATMPGSTLT